MGCNLKYRFNNNDEWFESQKHIHNQVAKREKSISGWDFEGARENSFRARETS